METTQYDTTVVGLFGSFGEAQSASSELVNTGFREEDIQIITRGEGWEEAVASPRSAAGSRPASSPANPGRSGENLPGRDGTRRDVLVVAAQRRGEQAAAIVDSCGAVNVNLRSDDLLKKSMRHTHRVSLAEARHAFVQFAQDAGS